MKDKLEGSDIVFSLDIGTRTIIGLVARYEDGVLNILASETMSHEKRAMFDGQIHDIGSVVKVAKKVKEALELQIGFPLEKVAVAAAGRSLEVSRAKVTIKVDASREIDKSTIKSAELEAVREAEELLKEKIDMRENKYHCVGHTVAHYFLDDTPIENLEGHMGNSITIDVIATFLPHTVVDSLNTVMNRLGLEIVNMTLEPIAAINVAVKKNLRLLNIALVDIGAGTSDIAITKDGTINSYAMVPNAGDGITESIVKSFLLDYDIAEALKVDLNKNEEHEFQDILGLTHKLSSEEILDKIDSSIEELARDISEKILDLNEGPPSVVFLIGGGAQIRRLEKYIAKELEIPEERVAIKDTSLVENVLGISDNLRGSDAITPIGIAIMSIENNYKDFIEVVLNDEKIKLFNIEKSTITDALLKAKFNPRDLVAKRGQSLKYYLNGEQKEILGRIGEPAKVYLNGELTSLDRRVKNNDNIVIEVATAGEAAKAFLSDISKKEKTIYLDEIEYKLESVTSVMVNDFKVDEDILLTEGDRVETTDTTLLKRLYEQLELDIENIEVIRDGETLGKDEILNEGDRLQTIDKKKIEEKRIQQERVEQQKRIEKEIDAKIEMKNNKHYISLIINSQKQSIEYEKDQFQFVDIFDHIDFDLTKPKGDLSLKVNDKDAEYLQILVDGDRVDIYWEK